MTTVPDAAAVAELNRWRGSVDGRIEGIEKSVERMEGKLDKMVTRVNMAQGGWVAIMAIVGLVMSAAGVVVGIVKLFQK